MRGVSSKHPPSGPKSTSSRDGCSHPASAKSSSDALPRRNSGAAVGDHVDLRNSEWTIVGVYETGDTLESGMLTDASTLQSAYGVDL